MSYKNYKKKVLIINESTPDLNALTAVSLRVIIKLSDTEIVGDDQARNKPCFSSSKKTEEANCLQRYSIEFQIN